MMYECYDLHWNRVYSIYTSRETAYERLLEYRMIEMMK